MHKILHLKFLLLLAMMLVGVGNVKACHYLRISHSEFDTNREKG